MKFGAHVSIAGGIWNAPVNAAKIGCEIFQMFTRSPQGGVAPKFGADIIKKFKDACREYDFDWYVIHSPYYINFASGRVAIRTSSARVIREELERGTLLGAAAVMFHPGSARDVGRESGVRLVVEGIKKVLKGYRGACQLLIEISAGAGEVIGDTFEEVGMILERVGEKRLGVCFDTQHAFGSGYDLRTPSGVKKVFDQFNNTIGLERLVMSHCNDSKVELGTHKDRHEFIGQGLMGLGAFRALLAEPRLRDLPFIVETPPEGQARDIALLKKLRAQ